MKCFDPDRMHEVRTELRLVSRSIRTSDDPSISERFKPRALPSRAATAVHDHGTAEIVAVPGDQMNALRRAIRAELRQRFGYSTRTFTQDGLLVASSPETRHLIEQTAARAMADLDLEDRTKVDDSDWRFHWATWSVS